MRYHLLIAFIFSCTISFAQTAVIKKLEQKNPVTKEVYVFPKVFVRSSPLIGKKINDRLRSEILEADPSARDNEIFNQVWRSKDQSPILTEMSYKIIRNDRSILSLQISAEGCGAYCEYWERYFTFDLKTGNQLFIDSLMNKEGLNKLLQNANRYKQKKIHEKLKELKDTLKTSVVQKDKELLDYYTEMLSLYTECSDHKLHIEYMHDIEFSVDAYNLVIYIERCSAHYNRNLDELWIFGYLSKLKAWSKYLTGAGRLLLNR